MTHLDTTFALATLLGAAAAVPNEGEDPTVIRLKVGSEVVGVIEPDGFDEAKGVRVRRVDDGALIEIGFDQMVAEDALRIRGAHGYLPDEPDPVLVAAVKVRLMTGDEFLGVIVEQGSETFKLRQGTKVWELNRSRVREIVPVRVDALEVYDAEELYAEELSRRNPVTALDHYNLALYCESLQLWPRVQEQLGAVQALDPQFKAEIVHSKLRRAALRLELSEDAAQLSKAQRLAQREQYDVALGVIDDFMARKGGSAMRAEFEKTRRQIQGQRDKWIRNQVIFRFFILIERTARSIASDPESSSKEGRKRIELDGTRLALEATAKALKVQPAEVRSVWESEKRQTASWHYASYGSGTWTLGDMAVVLKGIVKEDPAKGAASAAGGAAGGGESLEDKVKKLIEQKKKEQEEAARRARDASRQPQKAKAAEIADIAPTEEEWWAALGADDRTEYLLAWWADHDPHVKSRPEGRSCTVCTGTGTIRYFDRGGDDKWVPCPRCKGACIDRIVRYQ